MDRFNPPPINSSGEWYGRIKGFMLIKVRVYEHWTRACPCSENNLTIFNKSIHQEQNIHLYKNFLFTLTHTHTHYLSLYPLPLPVNTHVKEFSSLKHTHSLSLYLYPLPLNCEGSNRQTQKNTCIAIFCLLSHTRTHTLSLSLSPLPYTQLWGFTIKSKICTCLRIFFLL